ncbi:MAG: bifunctional diguanylate cyclase/phosphodiesterase [Lachnospiraceae bacterium]
MHKFSEDLFWNAIDLNETIIFEYDIREDVVGFSENLKKYVPMPFHISAFTERIDTHGKIHQKDIRKAIAFFTSPKDADKVRMEYIRFLDFNGDFRWYQIKGRMETAKDGTPVLLYGTMAYIDDETKQHHEEQAKTKDELTRLLTKEVMFQSIEEYLKTIPKDVIPDLLVIDIDDFMEWREMYGSIKSEGVLVEISRILKRAFRGSDLIGRVGEDRFAVFMKGVHTGNVLLERASYVRQTVKEVWRDFENSGGVTVSIGISVMHAEEVTVDKLYARALAALDDAKESGRDTYVLYTSEMERMDTSINPILSTKEMELIRNILDPMCTWAYAVDDHYQILYQNEALKKQQKNGASELCYIRNKGYSEPCPDCPLRLIDEKTDSLDSSVYSADLRTSVPVRTTKIVMRNGKNIYLIASVKENIESQIREVNESGKRVQDALYAMQDIVWDVNISKNMCVRMKEKNIKSVMDLRIENWKRLREYYAEYVVCAEDRNTFFEATDPKYLKQAIRAGRSILYREVRLKNIQDEYEWYGIYSVFLNQINNKMQEKAEAGLTGRGERDDFRVMIICLNVNEYKRRSLEDAETKIKYEIMKQKSTILKEMALNYERHENVNEMIGILVYEYQVAEAGYYLCSMFDEVFLVDKKDLANEWSLLDSLRCHPDDQENFDLFKEAVKTTAQTQKTTVRLYNKYQVPIWYTVTIQTLHGLNNMPVRYLGTLQNVNTEMEIKAEMEYRAEYDSLTGLYNSDTFYLKAKELLHLKPEKQFAVISIDIDKFRLINDRYGIEIGNRCLAILGKAIREIAPEESFAKRYQGDVFSVLISYRTEQDLLNYMSMLSAKLRDHDSMPASISLVYGIYKVIDRELPVRLMCDRARLVKKQVKGSILTNYAVYDDIIQLKFREQAEIEEEMQKALQNREFIMFLQPQIQVKDRRVYGAEALVRWKHPTRGLLVPAQFLPLFESNGFITRLDVYIWEEACRYLAELIRRDATIPISINISRVHIGNTDLPDILEGLVEKYQVPPYLLELEITENLFMDDVTQLFMQMSELKKRGFKILMDDFGSGYSSLNMLRNAPVDTLKIDRFFLDEIMSTERGKIIVEASVRMAKQLGLLTVAEGVETIEQLDFLEGIGCDIAQGFYFSKPVPIEQFEIFLAENK